MAGIYTVRLIEKLEELPAAMDVFFNMMRPSREDKEEFLIPERERFFRHMSHKLCEAGYLRLYFLKLNNAPIAAVMCFDYGYTRFLYNSGYEPAYASLSSSLLLKALCLGDAINEGMQYFDFLRGAEGYKYHLGANDMRLIHLSIQRGFAPATTR